MIATCALESQGVTQFVTPESRLIGTQCPFSVILKRVFVYLLIIASAECFYILGQTTNLFLVIYMALGPDLALTRKLEAHKCDRKGIWVWIS